MQILREVSQKMDRRTDRRTDGCKRRAIKLKVCMTFDDEFSDETIYAGVYWSHLSRLSLSSVSCCKEGSLTNADSFGTASLWKHLKINHIYALQCTLKTHLNSLLDSLLDFFAMFSMFSRILYSRILLIISTFYVFSLLCMNVQVYVYVCFKGNY